MWSEGSILCSHLCLGPGAQCWKCLAATRIPLSPRRARKIGWSSTYKPEPWPLSADAATLALEQMGPWSPVSDGTRFTEQTALYKENLYFGIPVSSGVDTKKCHVYKPSLYYHCYLFLHQNRSETFLALYILSNGTSSVSRRPTLGLTGLRLFSITEFMGINEC